MKLSPAQIVKDALFCNNRQPEIHFETWADEHCFIITIDGYDGEYRVMVQKELE